MKVRRAHGGSSGASFLQSDFGGFFDEGGGKIAVNLRKVLANRVALALKL